jgi:hypothetical protein
MNRKLAAWFSCAVLLCTVFSILAWADSNARIVRLSSVEGNVQIDRGTGDGFAKAFLNMPIAENVRLSTTDDGRAEVEFEDGSTIHLAPGTILQFTELSLRSSGAKVSTVDVQQGKAYFDFRGHRDDEFTVTFQHQKVDLNKAAHFRLDVDNDNATLAVFKGDLRVAGPSGEVEVGKKESVTFDVGNNDQYELARNIQEDPEDAWDKEQSEYHERYTASNSYDAPYSYGMTDLAYYGNYYNVPGYGMCWRPYFAGMGWDPFMDGAWMWYPGFGYTWVSAYPWGWMPYHYGSWIFAPGYGWAWRPGLTWVSWNYVPRLINPPVRYVPPRPPVVGTHTTVIVGRGPSAPRLGPGTKVVIKGDDAGLGVPRGIRNLGQVNREVRDRGSAAIETFGPRRVTVVSPAVPGAAVSPEGPTRSAPTTGAAPARTTAPSAPRSAPMRPAGPRVNSEGGSRGGERMSAPAPRAPSAPSSAPRMSAPSHSSAPSPSTSPHK